MVTEADVVGGSPSSPSMTPKELKAADEAFAALQAHVASLEATLQKYQTVLDFMFTNDTFFTNLMVQLKDRFLNVKAQV
jgi:hypothetical protein